VSVTTEQRHHCDIKDKEHIVLGTSCGRASHGHKCKFCGRDTCADHIGASIVFRRNNKQVDSTLNICTDCSWSTYQEYGLKPR